MKIRKFVNHCYTIKKFYSSRNSEVRVRFAPSPTGFLHLGGLRTALYNYLYAKSKNGTFVLRIEDTDQSRIVEGAIEKLEYDLHWAGLIPDEGPSKGGLYGPYLQSQRLSLYREEVKKLLDNGSAYYCFCNERRLDLLRKDALRRREIPKYDNRCRNLSKKEVEEKLNAKTSYCIRFKLNPFLEPLHDLVYGDIVNNIAAVEGDPIILKSDGYPTYHFANVVDDHHMKITHVLRGVEWQKSTTKHILLYKALNWTPPQYAHLPLLMNADGTKLSKRNSNMTVEAYRNQGIFPIALINCIVSSGGAFPKTNNQNKSMLKSLQELTQIFRLDLMNENNCQVQHHRLNEFNRMAIKSMVSKEESLNLLVQQAKTIIEEGLPDQKLLLDEKKIEKMLLWYSDRIFTLKDLIGPDFSFLWTLPPVEHLLNFEKKYFDVLNNLIERLEKIDDFNNLSFSQFFKTFSKEYKVDYPILMGFLRICLSGLKRGPGVGDMMIQFEKRTVLERLRRAQLLYKNRTT